MYFRDAPIGFYSANSDTNQPLGPITADDMDWLLVFLFRYKCFYGIWQRRTINSPNLDKNMHNIWRHNAADIQSKRQLEKPTISKIIFNNKIK